VHTPAWAADLAAGRGPGLRRRLRTTAASAVCGHISGFCIPLLYPLGLTGVTHYAFLPQTGRGRVAGRNRHIAHSCPIQYLSSGVTYGKGGCFLRLAEEAFRTIGASTLQPESLRPESLRPGNETDFEAAVTTAREKAPMESREASR